MKSNFAQNETQILQSNTTLRRRQSNVQNLSALSDVDIDL